MSSMGRRVAEEPAKYSWEVEAPDVMLALLEGIPWISLLGDGGRLRSTGRDGEDSAESKIFFCCWYDVLSSD